MFAKTILLFFTQETLHHTSDNDNDNQLEKSLLPQNKELSKPLITKIESFICKQKENQETLYEKNEAGFSKSSCSNAPAKVSV